MDEIRHYMSQPLSIVHPDVTIVEAAEQMLNKEVGALLVSEDGKDLGVVTEVDITRRALAKRVDSLTTKISSIMSHPIISLDARVSIEEAYLKMRENDIRHILVTANDEIVGIVSLKGVAKYLYSVCKEKTD